MTAPAAPRDAQHWTGDLMSLDDKLDAVFGPLDEAGQTLEAVLLIGVADYGQRAEVDR
jgi:hypothetical protein